MGNAAEIRRLNRVLSTHAEDADGLMASVASDHEAVLASQMSESSAKVLDLEKQLDESRALASKHAASAGSSEVSAARAEAAEAEAARLREEGATRDAEIHRLKEALKAQVEEVAAVMATGGGDEHEQLLSEKIFQSCLLYTSPSPRDS